MNRHVHESSTKRILTKSVFQGHLCVRALLLTYIDRWVLIHMDKYRYTYLHVYMHMYTYTYMHVKYLDKSTDSNLYTNPCRCIHPYVYTSILCLYMNICCVCSDDTDDVVGRVLGLGI